MKGTPRGQLAAFFFLNWLGQVGGIGGGSMLISGGAKAVKGEFANPPQSFVSESEGVEQIAGMFKSMPMTRTVVGRLANRNIPLPERLGLSLRGNLAEQSLAELGQSFASLGVDSFFAALGADLPGFDAWKEMRSIIENAPQMAFQVTPMAAIGTGFAGYRDFRGGARYTGDPINLERAGFSEERAVHIAAEGDPEKRQGMIREGWSLRTAEDIKRGARLEMEGVPKLEEVPGLREGFTPAEKNAGRDYELRSEGKPRSWVGGKAEGPAVTP